MPLSWDVPHAPGMDQHAPVAKRATIYQAFPARPAVVTMPIVLSALLVPALSAFLTSTSSEILVLVAIYLLNLCFLITKMALEHALPAIRMVVSPVAIPAVAKKIDATPVQLEVICMILQQLAFILNVSPAPEMLPGFKVHQPL